MFNRYLKNARGELTENWSIVLLFMVLVLVLFKNIILTPSYRCMQ